MSRACKLISDYAFRVAGGVEGAYADPGEGRLDYRLIMLVRWAPESPLVAIKAVHTSCIWDSPRRPRHSLIYRRHIRRLS